jgi:hypothetical protein
MQEATLSGYTLGLFAKHDFKLMGVNLIRRWPLMSAIQTIASLRGLWQMAWSYFHRLRVLSGVCTKRHNKSLSHNDDYVYEDSHPDLPTTQRAPELLVIMIRLFLDFTNIILTL